MPRWTTLGLLATVSTAACGGGGAHEAVRSGLGTRTGPVAHVNQRTASIPSAAANEESPQLVTITGRSGASPYNIPGVVPPSGSMPPSGGYMVRSTGSSGRTPSDTTVALAPPPPVSAPSVASVDGEAAGAGYGRGGAERRASPGGTRGRASAGDSRGVDELMRAPVGGGASTRVASTPSAAPSAGMRSSWGGGHAGGATASAQGAGRVAVAARPMPAPRAAPAHNAAPRASAASSGGGGAGYAAAAEAAPMQPAAVVTGTTTIAVPPGSTVAVVPATPPVVVEAQQEPEGGVLTAASVGDADRRANYLDYLTRHPGEAETFGLDMTRRVRFRVLDANNHPVHHAAVTLAGGNVRAEGHTHADGVWDFFPSVVAPGVAGGFGVHVQVENVGVDTTCQVPAVGDAGDVVVRLPAVVAAPPPVLDLAFAIDVTGSMGDELSYVNREVASIVQRVQARAPGVRVRVGATFYRDRVDEFVVQQIPFSTNVFGFANAMHGVTASGGGDYPEDMNAGLEAAMTRLSWSDGPAVRVLVLIADAPPQFYPTQFGYRQAMLDASRRGIRILPVGASGADRSVEYLFRAMGAFTSTPYVYLTDDSGVGSSHMEADTDRVGVERFNDLLTRVILADLAGQGMHEPGPLGPQT